ncbi:Rrf2 family transcriptional regulator [Erwinia oleae]|uniref:Rrf2 family transcriptional regulator n=1 Tax=Erwinia oleae TaxID=796334 RepID=UPI0009078A23|nr:Rrf2 family transcriptional regulator [Erwinia oleae]
MKRDSKLSAVLHVQVRMAEYSTPITLEQRSTLMSTHPVVVRRLMAGLRERGYVRAEKGHRSG